jgi:hypothetical protein
MKRIFLAAMLLAFTFHSYAQKIEVSAYATGSLSHYIGNYATATTYIGPSASPTNTVDKRDNNPYGTKNTFGNSFGIQAQFISKQGIIGGLQAGIENLKSEVHIDELKGTYPAKYPFDGTSTLSKQFFNLNPYIGYRFILNDIKLDLMPGIDIGASISSSQKIRSKSDDNLYLTEGPFKDIPVDYRLRFGSAIYYNRIGLVASYSHGLNNYVETSKGPGYAARSEVIRFGLNYRFY